MAGVTLNFFYWIIFWKKKELSDTHTKKNPLLFVFPNKLLFESRKLTLRALLICYLRPLKKVFQADFSKLAEELKWVIPS